MRSFHNCSGRVRAMLVLSAPFLASGIRAQELQDAVEPIRPLPSLSQQLAPMGPEGLPLDPLAQERLSAPSNATSVFAGAAPSSRPGTLLESPFRVGPLEIRPHAEYTFTYGNGVSTSPGTQRTTAQHDISPGLLLETDHISLDYTPSLNYYSNRAFEDHLDHSAYFNAHASLTDWNSRLTQTYSSTQSPLIETGQQTKQETFSTGLAATYQYNEKVSFDLNLNQRIQSAEAFSNSREWSTTDWINYHLTDRTSLGVGAAFGYVDVSRGSDMTYEHALGRISSRITDKLNAEISGGMEIRQYLDQDGSDRLNPILNARLVYNPWQFTILSLAASRTVDTAIFEGYVTETSQLQALLQQRLFGHYFLDVDAGFRTSQFEGGTSPDLAGRSDDLTTVSVALRATVLTRGSASVFYRHSSNSSSLEIYSFDSDQYGFSVGYRF
jgi:hypothetical protein